MALDLTPAKYLYFIKSSPRINLNREETPMNEVLKKLLLVLVVTPFILSVFSKTFAFDENKNIQESQVLVTANSLDVTQDDIEKIKNAAMKATNHISQVLGIEEKGEIEIIIAGAYSINLPKTSGGVIYIPATYKNNLMSIFHEIYHAIALRHSRKKFFSEGMATFFQFELTNNTAFLHSYVANNEDSIIPLIRLKTYQDVFQPTPQHDKDKRTFAYSMAGSFFSFLAENYGYQKLQDLYNTATLNYKKVYGKKFKELEVEWKAYIFGELPPQDYPKNADAQFELGQKYHLWKYKKAKQYYKLAAEQGHLDAQYNLGLLLKDVKEAVYWFSLAAEKGHLDAQKKLGSMYYEGREVPHNYNEAIKWYTMAAYQSDINAQRKLGLCYIEADVDYVKAYAWLTMAAEQGSNMSKKKRDKMSSKMTPEQIVSANELIKELKAR